MTGGDGDGHGPVGAGDDPAVPRPDGGDEPPSDESSTCDEAGCGRAAAVVLHIPWGDDRAVCPAHARVLARPDGVVAEPMEGAEAEWP